MSTCERAIQMSVPMLLSIQKKIKWVLVPELESRRWKLCFICWVFVTMMPHFGYDGFPVANNRIGEARRVSTVRR